MMKAERARTDAPSRPAWIAPLRWVARLKTRILQVALFRFDADGVTDPELADLWLMMLASDPEGTWHAWPDPVRSAKLDDQRDA